MSTPTDPHDQHPREDDPGADTATWRAFASAGDAGGRPKAVGVPFRVLTLLAGLVVFGLLVLLLLR